MPGEEDLDILLSLFEERVEQAFACVSDPVALESAMAETEALIKENWSRINSLEPEQLQSVKGRLSQLVEKLDKLQVLVKARLSWVGELNRSLVERVEQSP